MNTTESPNTPKQAYKGIALLPDDVLYSDCIRCGMCLTSCPTYLEEYREMDSPRGRIYLMKAIQEGRIGLEASALRHLDLCLDCRACETVCPSGVQYGTIVEHARIQIERQRPRSLPDRIFRALVVKRLLPFPGRMDISLWPVRAYQALGMDRWIGKYLPKSMRQMVTFLPPIPSRTVMDRIEEVFPAEGAKRGRVGLLTGCIGSIVFSPTNLATARVLARNGYEVVVPREQGCCGSLLYHIGLDADAKNHARRLIRVFADLKLDAILSNAAGCGSFLKHYGGVFEDEPEFAETARTFAEKVRDVNEFLESIELRDGMGELNRRVAYHDACHLAHAQKITKEPRSLLARIPGLELVELPESLVCCGSAGIYNILEPEMSERLMRRKVEHIRETGAEIVATANPGCLLQIKKGLREQGLAVEAVHPIDLLWRAYEAGNGANGKTVSRHPSKG